MNTLGLSIGNTPIPTENFSRVIVPSTMEKFRAWLTNQLETRNWAQSDLVRASGLAPSAISNLINGKRRPGVDSAVAIARALALPESEVFQVAGILTEKPPGGRIVNIITHLASDLPEEEQEGIVEFIRMRKKVTEAKHAASSRNKDRSK